MRVEGTITYKVAVYAPAEWAGTLTLFHLYQYMYSVDHTIVMIQKTSCHPSSVVTAVQGRITAAGQSNIKIIPGGGVGRCWG
jgi:hypothetical protein